MLTIRMIAVALLCFSSLAFGAKEDGPPPADWSFLQKKLKKAGFKPKFISAMQKSYDPSEFLSVLELNCLLFLRKSDYHGPQVSGQAVDDVRGFIARNESSLSAAEKKFGVSGSVIAGLLWMESRFGENQGRFHVASVFLNLLQADRPQVIAHLKLEAAPRFTPRLNMKVATSITEKAKVKAKWALSELKAVEKMYFKDKKMVAELRGSFSGAFGMPQFIPSSYITYSRAMKKSKAPNLAKPGDAIFSVANYLKESGWKKKKTASHEKALLRYNNSRDYARAILKLADEAEESKRTPAGKQKKKRDKRRKRTSTAWHEFDTGFDHVGDQGAGRHSFAGEQSLAIRINRQPI